MNIYSYLYARFLYGSILLIERLMPALERVRVGMVERLCGVVCD